MSQGHRGCPHQPNIWSPSCPPHSTAPHQRHRSGAGGERHVSGGPARGTLLGEQLHGRHRTQTSRVSLSQGGGLCRVQGSPAYSQRCGSSLLLPAPRPPGTARSRKKPGSPYLPRDTWSWARALLGRQPGESPEPQSSQTVRPFPALGLLGLGPQHGHASPFLPWPLLWSLLSGKLLGQGKAGTRDTHRGSQGPGDPGTVQCCCRDPRGPQQPGAVAGPPGKSAART